MDPVSQAALGAIAARVAAPSRLAGPVLLVGAVAGAMPDIDVVFSPGGDFFDVVRSHRGITHSLFFAFTAGPLLGWLFARWWGRRRHGVDASPAPGETAGWMLAVTAAVLSHPLLDVLTPYGTQLLQPFSDARFAVHAMPIIDPLYTGVLLLGVVLAARSLAPRRLASLTLVLSCGYLALGWQLGVRAREFARDDLVAQGEAVLRIEAFPTLLQPWQRQLVARTAKADFIGQMTMWAPCPPVWTHKPSHRGAAVDALLATAEGRTFDWFALGWVHYTLQQEAAGDRLVAADLRYSLGGDPAKSIFAVSVPVTAAAEGVRLSGPVGPEDTRAADPARLARALGNVFTPVCRSAQVAEGQGRGGLDALHGEG